MRAAALPWIFMFLASACHGAGEVSGRVVFIADGDTVTILTPEQRQIKVRLAQIDAPEREQAFGSRSRRSLAELVFNADVRVVVEDTDQYGRTVGRVYRDALDVNAEQVRRGMAWAYRRYVTDSTLLELEEKARRTRTGLWADPKPVPPWRFRRQRDSRDGALLDATAAGPSTPAGSGG